MATNAGQILAAAGPLGVQAHASELMPAIERMLADSGWPSDGVTEVFVSIGPGSFTGLRVGVSVARTLAWSVGARIVAVPTLECLACNALAITPPPATVAVLLDAKSSRVFGAAFRLMGGCYRPILEAQMDAPQAFLARCPRPLAVLGEGIPNHRQPILDSGAAILDPSSWVARTENVVRVGLSLADAGHYTAAGELLPLYIRRPDPEEKWERLHGGG